MARPARRTASGSRPACSRRRAAARCGSPPTTRRRSRSSATTSTRPRRDMARMIDGAAPDAGDLRASRRCGPTAPSRFNVPDGDSDEALRAHVARTTFAIYHPVGTCAIGSVVDAELRVNGPRGAARRRRLGDADGPARQHQRADDRDRRARRRPDQGRGAAAARAGSGPGRGRVWRRGLLWIPPLGRPTARSSGSARCAAQSADCSGGDRCHPGQTRRGGRATARCPHRLALARDDRLQPVQAVALDEQLLGQRPTRRARGPTT